MTNHKTCQRFSAEVRERAVRMVHEHRAEHTSQWAAIASIWLRDGKVRSRSRAAIGRKRTRTIAHVVRQSVRAAKVDAPSRQTSLKHVVVMALVKDGIVIWAANLVEDGRRLR
jgi:hypothetical protein